MPPPSHSNVARFLALMAASQPDACAVKAPVGGGGMRPLLYEERSFAALHKESDALAFYLQTKGLKQGDRCLLMVRPGLDLIRLCFALFKAGIVPVVIDPGMGLRNFLMCVQHTAPEALVGIPLAIAVSRLFPRPFRSLNERILVSNMLMTKALRNMMNSAPGASFPDVPTKPDDLAAILFTSGSTGAPKGVLYTHGIFEAQVALIRDAYGIRAREVDLPMLPIFALFNPALGMTTIVPKMNPGRPAKVDPRNIIAAIREHQVTNSFGSPVLWRKIASYCAARNIVLPQLQRILMAGAPVLPDLVRTCTQVFPNATVHTPYGATECLPLTTISGPEILQCDVTATPTQGTCLGRPLPSMGVKILPISDQPQTTFNPETETLPHDCIGEIIACGPVVTPAYHNRPEATLAAKCIDPNGLLWHRMGDLGYLDKLGQLWFCGRKAERVSGPEKTFYTDCCEKPFNSHPLVFRSALIGLQHEGQNICPALVVEPLEEAWPLSSKIRQNLASELRQIAEKFPETASIKRFFLHRRFPVDVRHNAKIHRLTLAKLARSGKLTEIS